MVSKENLKKCYVKYVVMLLIASILVAQPVQASTYKDISNDSEWEVLRIVNKERLKEGLEPLSMFLAIQKCARTRGVEIKDVFSHTRPNNTTCFTILDEKKVLYRSAGENIAAGQPTPNSVMASWLNSPGHRANILSGSFQHIGIGYKKGGDYYHNWVQMFVGGCAVDSIKVNSKDTVKIYKKGTTVEKMNRYLVIKCSHGTSYTPIVDKMCKGYSKTKTGKQTIKVSYQGAETTFKVNIKK